MKNLKDNTYSEFEKFLKLEPLNVVIDIRESHYKNEKQFMLKSGQKIRIAA